jgi:hypothetical protein
MQQLLLLLVLLVAPAVMAPSYFHHLLGLCLLDKATTLGRPPPA